ncbi:NTP transferase domain-containing protein [Phyllobacterium zundukense]|uniref:4-diphosphocytidyl-2C-methyl-D-erythritol kinase n=1 Tax=Phyllobacterium zundukense TaxID=1867719 RepID=A0A2N9VVV2_9HYPH|nr:molybdopterin-binding/glycosyltransferase family 2 protein [Phyllobacterium zundukense]ATU91356.1 4-diphosphocytidyl-2C-methyl-D-erythritol kinase [Phyllobacterium zundukense]PIO43620.1 4-diphosphocytidyl-2C-methyl-D-erythritol kinase [Phyllobacterium zundukense]
MIFGEISIENALGAILAHSTHAGALKLKKGHVLTESDVAQLQEAGVTNVIAARLQEADLDENAAALKLTEALQWFGVQAGPAATGRVNCYAQTAGLFAVDADLINAINAIDPSVTIATLKPFERVEQGQMVATIKIIPFAVAVSVMERILDLSRDRIAFGVHGFAGSRIGLIQTTLPSVKATVLDKTRRVIEARIAANHGFLTTELRPVHASKPLSAAIRKLQNTNDIVIVFGASAVVDQGDIVPEAMREAGGNVHHVGMPVDPGNLLVLGELDGKPVIGAPGCARSPKENGFDWVLERLMAKIPVTKADIVGMGVGGLLMEIPTRPQPRDPRPPVTRPNVAIAVLAAGQSTRMNGPNKLLATFDDVPLVRRSALTAIEAGGDPVIAVLGHMAEQCSAALDGLNVVIALNKDYASGLASSLQTAIRHVPSSADGMMMLLADMPALSPSDLKSMINRFQNTGGQSVVRATFQGKRGNPVILPRLLFDEVFTLAGDVGARHLIERGDIPVIDVELGEAAVIDVDTPDMLNRAGGTITGTIR